MDFGNTCEVSKIYNYLKLVHDKDWSIHHHMPGAIFGVLTRFLLGIHAQGKYTCVVDCQRTTVY